MTTFRKASENRSFKFLQEEVSKKWEKKNGKGIKVCGRERERGREREGEYYRSWGMLRKLKQTSISQMIEKRQKTFENFHFLNDQINFIIRRRKKIYRLRCTKETED